MQSKNKIPFELSDYVLKKFFCEAGERQGWLNDSSLAVAASGGGDSIALLWLCAKFFAGRVCAIHINHGIRGAEADGDENFTREFARNIGAEFFSEKISVPTSREKGESLEAAARRLRIEKLCEIAKSNGIKNILLGHNRDDLAETVFFNIIRGTGIRGSVGITEATSRGEINFFRPLLKMRRDFLREILRVRGISWREDSTNNQDNYTRNFIRLKLFPVIEKNINASVIEHLASFGEDMRKIRERENSESEKLFEECREKNSGQIIFSRKILRSLDEEKRALIIRETGRKLQLKTLSRVRTDQLVKLIAGGENFIFQWCGGASVKCEKGKIFFEVKNNS